MSEALYIPFDCESGGIGNDVSLLSTHFAACDKNFNIVDELELFTKPNDGKYTTTAEALEINKINLIEHDKIAMTYSQAGGILREWLLKVSQNGKVKLIPMGKNIGGDVDWVTTHLLGKKTWNQYVSYRLYDLTGLVIYLKRKGKLAPDAPDSLEGLANYINVDFIAHTARGDNYAGIEVLKWLESL